MANKKQIGVLAFLVIAAAVLSSGLFSFAGINPQNSWGFSCQNNVTANHNVQCIIFIHSRGIGFNYASGIGYWGNPSPNYVINSYNPNNASQTIYACQNQYQYPQPQAINVYVGGKLISTLTPSSSTYQNATAIENIAQVPSWMIAPGRYAPLGNGFQPSTLGGTTAWYSVNFTPTAQYSQLPYQITMQAINCYHPASGQDTQYSQSGLIYAGNFTVSGAKNNTVGQSTTSTTVSATTSVLPANGISTSSTILQSTITTASSTSTSLASTTQGTTTIQSGSTAQKAWYCGFANWLNGIFPGWFSVQGC